MLCVLDCTLPDRFLDAVDTATRSPKVERYKHSHFASCGKMFCATAV